MTDIAARTNGGTIADQLTRTPRGAPAPAAPSVTKVSAVTLALAVLTAIAMTAVLLACVLSLLASSEWWRGFRAATIVTVMASFTTVPIIAWGLRAGVGRPEMGAAAFFASGAARAGVSLGGAMLAVTAAGYPKAQTLLLVVPYYFALLAAETFVLAQVLWTARRFTAADSEQHQTTGDHHV